MGCHPQSSTEELVASEIRSQDRGQKLALAVLRNDQFPSVVGVDDVRGEALGWVNHVRESVGLHTVREESALQEAASGHARFLALHQDLYDEGLSFHHEEKGREGFLAERYWERQALFDTSEIALGEVIAFQPSSAAAVGQWMESVYHRIPLIDTRASAGGYAVRTDNGRTFGVMELSQVDAGPEGDSWIDKDFVAYPPNGAVMVPVSWDGNETPQPMAPPSGYPSGPVFTLSAADSERVRVASSSLMDDNGNAIPHTLLDAENDAFFAAQTGLALYANDPLQPGMTYRITLKGFRGSAVFEWSSTFTTTPKTSCNLTGQEECGLGKACYPSAENTICAWEGILPEGAVCSFQNECVAGTTCVAGTCSRLCDLDGGEWTGCETICGGGTHRRMNGHEAVGVCDTPACSPHTTNECGQGTTCTVGSEMMCTPPGNKKIGDLCDEPSDCGAGLACIHTEMGQRGVCEELCALGVEGDGLTTELPRCANRCSGDVHLLAQHPGLATCTD